MDQKHFEQVVENASDMDLSEVKEKILSKLDNDGIKVRGYNMEVSMYDYLKDVKEDDFLGAFTDTADLHLDVNYTYNLFCELVGETV